MTINFNLMSRGPIPLDPIASIQIRIQIILAKDIIRIWKSMYKITANKVLPNISCNNIYLNT